MTVYRRRIYNNGQISVPKKVQNLLNLKDGDLLFIDILDKSIIIIANHDNKNLNQCYLSRNRISIPKEIRNILGITSDTPLIMGITDDEKGIFIHIETGK
ncbi:MULTISPECIES: AbrB/MazE/SpoVT family DNA-binding domain-containing protein [Bacillati]|uniref:AbrB/MazE/SpoVT family DNA-binding domain-containing protein n=1 Tax=Niallia taxi TaxID=2499688 RepID=A0A437K753_9BACI|nr:MULTISPECIES: AbrB/MazE/SpoVT family DNA-binding domain-containing protein [Niallia]MDK8642962.1 AbrB/MazE/SpoVT family DNA-binding domain-containing protein [Niallia taxi]MED4038285.1 AbrB/MazE/SpoVT family DNA-binding domain-containing protein [Niallia taxi]MED4057600.1 AbrB/MazE/SpoVT family DNA-binding domain-containing protein [Niallia taxi]MED4120630.1 AbrB/MazE/SpoVT family DNA-binding domain-containing protein [Niallia taxi]RVT59439.1 AbrB/MazE/SpoVT family DNA-binding domain-contai